MPRVCHFFGIDIYIYYPGLYSVDILGGGVTDVLLAEVGADDVGTLLG